MDGPYSAAFDGIGHLLSMQKIISILLPLWLACYSVAHAQSPAPAWLSKLRLSGLSGPTDHPLAVINDQSFSEGEVNQLKLAGQTAQIKCVEIGQNYVLVQIQGLPGFYKLTMAGEVISLTPTPAAPPSQQTASTQTFPLPGSMFQPAANPLAATLSAMSIQQAQLMEEAQRQMAVIQKQLDHEMFMYKIKGFIAILIVAYVFFRLWRWLNNTERDLKTIADAAGKFPVQAVRETEQMQSSSSQITPTLTANPEHPHSRYMPKS